MASEFGSFTRGIDSILLVRYKADSEPLQIRLEKVLGIKSANHSRIKKLPTTRAFSFLLKKDPLI